MKKYFSSIPAILLTIMAQSLYAQHAHLHIDTRWEECSFHLDSSLTQKAFQQFTEEAGLVSYFRPLVDARPMGAGAVELSILQWNTSIDENSEAWNNTFVHPDSTHWLIDGPQLPFPGFTLRAGVTQKLDAGVYWTFRPGANYGFFGGQLQYNITNNPDKGWASAVRAGFMSLYGPEDISYRVYGLDAVGSKNFKLYKNWLSVSAYSSVSSYLSHSHEKSNVVDLKNENRIGVQGAAGAVLQVSILRLGVEYNIAKVNTLSYKAGFAYNFNSKK